MATSSAREMSEIYDVTEVPDLSKASNMSITEFVVDRLSSKRGVRVVFLIRSAATL